MDTDTLEKDIVSDLIILRHKIREVMKQHNIESISLQIQETKSNIVFKNKAGAIGRTQDGQSPNQ